MGARPPSFTTTTFSTYHNATMVTAVTRMNVSCNGISASGAKSTAATGGYVKGSQMSMDVGKAPSYSGNPSSRRRPPTA